MKLVNLKTLAEQTSLSVFTLRKYIIRCGMPCYRVGRKILVNPDECEAWFEQFKSEPARPHRGLKNRVNQTLKRLNLSP